MVLVRHQGGVHQHQWIEKMENIAKRVVLWFRDFSERAHYITLMKKIIRIGLKVDAFLQGVIILGLLGSGIGGIIYSNVMFFYGLMLLMLLGFWQVSSALIFGWVLRDASRRGLYLLGVLGYFTTHIVLTVSDILHPSSGFAYLAMALSILSVVALAVKYFSFTVQDMVRWNTSYIK